MAPVPHLGGRELRDLRPSVIQRLTDHGRTTDGPNGLLTNVSAGQEPFGLEALGRRSRSQQVKFLLLGQVQAATSRSEA
jgi:hypothetical protein